jgi:beta-lactamase regulating signal transducer with metallopeptidase domain
MINYILQVILFQVLFLAIYDFFLSKETFFTKNRWYLISTPMLSFLIPLIKIPSFQKAVPQEFIVYLPEIFLSPQKVIQNAIDTTAFYDSINYVAILFWLGVVLFSILFLIKLVKIINLIRKQEVVAFADFTLILIPNQTKAFSFFNYIFLGKEIEEKNREKIIQHELVHSKQKHSLDLLLFEFLKIVMWFNPMIYFYQQRITLVHEYISDEIVSKSESKESYINNLLSNFFQVENISFINQFYKQSFIKKRIIMMTKTQSKKMNQLKYLVLIPVLASMLFYSSCSETSTEEISAKKEKFKMYTLSKDGTLIHNYESEKETYLDAFLGISVPKEFKEIYEKDLSELEKEEYYEVKRKFEKPEIPYKSLKLFKMNTGRKVAGMIYDSSKMENSSNKDSKSEEISFLKIGKAPTFPGCDSGDKDCFSKNIQKHFAQNFDSNLPKTLSLKAGRKRVFIGFKIDADGNIVDIKARAPHKKIEEEVVKVMSSLPKMMPGEQEGKAVSVKYSIPFTLVVE